MMATPKFWDWPGDWRSRALAPLGLAYGAVAAHRLRRKATVASARILTVGNFVAGGAGKTPTCLAIGALASQQNLNYAFLTRGFGGRAGAGPLLAQGQSAAMLGDEAGLLAAQAPTYVGSDRKRCAQAAIAAGAKLLILDDGLQSRHLKPDVCLAVVDGSWGIGNGLCLPAGPLRAPMAAQWAVVDGVIVIGQGRGAALAEEALRRGKQAFGARLIANNPSEFTGRKIFAATGLARPEKFHQTLREIGAEVVATQSFPDHFPYSTRIAEALFAQAARYKAALAITAKDWARWPIGAPRPKILDVEVKFTDERAIAQALSQGFGARPK